MKTNKKTTVRAVVVNDKREFYFVQHNEHNPADLGKWATIGGELENFDQDLQACLTREIAEEFGSNTAQEILVLCKLFTYEQSSRIDHFFLAKYSGVDLKPVEGHEILNAQWFPWHEIKSLSFFFGIEPDLCNKALRFINQSNPSHQPNE